MRQPRAGSNPNVPSRLAGLGAMLLGTVILSGCAGASMGPGGPFRGAGDDRPPPPALFVSPFGELFVAAPGQPWPVADWFLGADENLDGAVVFEEFATDGRRWFAHLDTDRDGRLGQAELWAYEASLTEFGGGTGGGDRRGTGEGRGLRGGGARPSGVTLDLAPQAGRGSRGQRGGGAGAGGGDRGARGYGRIAEAGFFNLPQPVKAADVNVDQRVTAEEWAAATQRWFLALDTDRDGRLTLATLPRTPLQQRAEARR